MEDIKIPNMELISEIGRGAWSVVYQARMGEDTYAVKLLKETAFHDLEATKLRFQKEASILARIHHPCLPEIKEVSEAQGRPYIVMENVVGSSLESIIEEKGSLAEETIISIAKEIARVLAKVARYGVVHRDVKPKNIIIEKSGRSKLIDFGFVMQAGSVQVGEEVAGTFFYSAPEQTGMLNRPLDGRADLYAFGVVLFECATGNLPFRSDDLSELLRQHAVEPPPDIASMNPNISPALRAIINKLLAKDPDDRYQSGDGLAADLEQIEVLNKALSVGKEIILGTQEGVLEYLEEIPLIARSAEIASFKDRFAKAKAGKGTAILIEGEAGSGKSRLGREILSIAQKEGATLISGKCSKVDPVPFAVLREAIEKNLRLIKRLPTMQRKEEEEKICKIIGEFAPLLKHFTPTLTVLLKDVPDLPQQERVQEIFYEAIAAFIVSLSQSSLATLFFIDDVQWMDDASRQVFARLANRMSDSKLFIIGVTRNEPEYMEALEHFAADMAPVLSYRMLLKGLDDKGVSELIQALLGAQKTDPDLVGQITVRSSGNPFAIVEYVQAMLDTGLLRPYWGAWVVVKGGLESLQLPSDVLQIVVKRISYLGESSKNILSIASAIGNRFQLEVLAQICEVKSEAVSSAVAEASRANLVECAEASTYMFVHDRVQEALYSTIESDKKNSLHQLIAEVLDKRGADIFDLARHYSLGKIELNPKRVYETNTEAGAKALETFAFQEAYAFLTLAHQSWITAKLPVDIILERSLALVCYHTGHMAKAVEHCQHAIDNTKDSYERAGYLSFLARIHMVNCDQEKSWKAIALAFKEIKRPVPNGTPLQLISALFEQIPCSKIERTGKGFGSAKGRDRLLYRILIGLNITVGALAYMENRTIIMLQMALNIRRPSLLLGPSHELVVFYNMYAAVLAMLRKYAKAESYNQKAIQTAEKIGDRGGLALATVYHGFAKEISGLSIEAETLYSRGLEEFGRWVDTEDYLYRGIELLFNLFLRGYVKEAWLWADRMLTRAKIKGAQSVEMARYFSNVYAVSKAYAASILTVLGRHTEGIEHLNWVKEFLKEAPPFGFLWGHLLSHFAMVYREQEQTGAPLEELFGLYRQKGLPPKKSAYYTRHYFVFQAYARLSQLMKVQESDRNKSLANFKIAVKELKQIADLPIIKSHYHILNAAHLRYAGKTNEALSELNLAENLARQIDSPWALYEAARLRAHILKDLGNPTASLREARNALALAAENGWTNRLHWIRSEFQIRESSRVSTTRVETATASTTLLKLKRYLDALLEVITLAASASFDPDEQARLTLDIIIRIFSAERAFLFLTKEGTDQLEFKLGRDSNQNDIQTLEKYSSTIVEQSRKSQKPIVVSGLEEGIALGSESAVVHELRSMMVTPLLIRGRLLGVVYLDNRLAKGVFTEDDLDVLFAAANNIAVALETMRTARIEMERQALEKANAILEEKVQERTRELKETYEKLARSEKLAALGKLGGAISHELRNPLGVIKNSAYFINMKVKESADEKVLKHLEIIDKEIDRSTNIIEDILAFARIKMPDLKPVKMVDAVNNALSTIAVPQGIKVEKDFPEGLPTANVDLAQINQVFINLIQNAFQAMPEGGELKISAALKDKGLIISFKDTGSGIPPENLQKIFDTLFTTKPKGTGFGLAICQSIIEGHKGKIEVDSVVGKGTAFKVILPASQT